MQYRLNFCFKANYRLLSIKYKQSDQPSGECTVLARASIPRLLKQNYSSENKIASQKPKLTPPIIFTELSSTYCFDFTAAALMVNTLVYFNSVKGLFYNSNLDIYLSSPWVKKGRHTLLFPSSLSIKQKGLPVHVQKALWYILDFNRALLLAVAGWSRN